MIIDLDTIQKELLLEILGISHAIRHMKGENTDDVETLIRKVVDSLKQSEEMHIFKKVFQEHKT